MYLSILMEMMAFWSNYPGKEKVIVEQSNLREAN